MCLKPQPVAPVPERTAQIAKSAFPKGSLAIRMGDELGGVYQDEAFASLFPARGQPGLAQVTVLQAHRAVRQTARAA